MVISNDMRRGRFKRRGSSRGAAVALEGLTKSPEPGDLLVLPEECSAFSSLYSRIISKTARMSFPVDSDVGICNVFFDPFPCA